MKTKPLEEQVKDILLKHTKTNYTMQLADIVEAISNLVEEEKRKAKIEALLEARYLLGKNTAGERYIDKRILNIIFDNELDRSSELKSKDI